MNVYRSAKLLALSSLITLGTPSIAHAKRSSGLATPIITGIIAGRIAKCVTLLASIKRHDNDVYISSSTFLPAAIVSSIICNKLRQVVAKEFFDESEDRHRAGLITQLIVCFLI